jgi:hypothetical protein
MSYYSYNGPLDKEKNIKVDRKIICRLFNQPIVIGSGVAKLRKGSQTGEVLEEFSSDSNKVSASAYELALFPEKTLPYDTEIFLTLDDGFVVAERTGQKCDFLNETSKITFSFTTEKEPVVVSETIDIIGTELEGGIVVAEIGGRYLVASPKSSELIIPWEEKEKVITHTENITGKTGWFIPSLNLLMNSNINIKNILLRNTNDSQNIFLTSDENINGAYAVDLDNLIPKTVDKNIPYKVHTFKFLEVN